MKNNQSWAKITSFILPHLRGTHASESGRIYIKLDPETSRLRRHKKPSRLRVGTKQYDVLKYIWKAGAEGRRYTDIQLFLIGGEENVAKGTRSKREEGYDYRTGEYKEVSRNPLRGNYSTWLSWMMPNYCSKNENGNWVLDEPALVNHFNQQL